MKKVILIVCLTGFANLTFSQIKNRLLGKWQAESKEITSMYHDSYQFFNDGRFVFKPDEYNGLNRIISINGIYKLKGDTLFMTPMFTKEVIKGYLIRSESTTLSDTWEIVGGQEKKELCTKRIKQTGIININEDNKIFTLDERKFFKINF
jgi:hypothetical protein